jgi:hypothetical protein
VKSALTSFPVPLTFSAVDLEESATIEIALDLQGETPDFEALADGINCVASVLSWGACPARSLVATERPDVTVLPARITGSAYRQSLVTHGLHPGAYRLLLTMLAQSHYEVLPLESAEIRAIGAGDALTLDQVLDAGFPAPPAPLPFALKTPVDLLALDEIVFRIRFATKEVSRIFSEIEDRLDEWNSLVIVGGYAGTFEATDLQILPRETTERFADTIEHAIGAVALSTASVDGLINMLCRIHASISPIVELEIE